MSDEYTLASAIYMIGELLASKLTVHGVECSADEGLFSLVSKVDFDEYDDADGKVY